MGDIDINKVAESAAMKAIEHYRLMRKQDRTETERQYLDLTKLILRRYRTVKESIDNCVGQVDWEIDGEVRTIYLAEVEKRNLRDRTMMEYIDRRIDQFRYYCETSQRKQEPRRWRVIQLMYLDPQQYDSSGLRIDLSINDLANYFSVDRSTIFDDLNWSYAELSALFWGLAL